MDMERKRIRSGKDRDQRSDDGGQKVVGRMQIRSAKDLKVYQKAYMLAMEIFNISKQWPA